jgi:hypothetical protein
VLRATVQTVTARTEAAVAAHPLASSMAAVDRSVEWTSFVLGDVAGPGWLRCEQVLRDPSFFTGWRAAVARHLAERHGAVPDQTSAGYVLQRYLRIPAYTGALLFHSARRVPALEPSRLAFRLERGCVETIALRPGPFWCLPTDPDARHPDAGMVPDDAALATVLRRQVVAHAAHFLRSYGPTVRLGRRTLWATVTDMIDSGLLLAGRSQGDEAAGMADARLVLAERFEPLTSASTARTLTDSRGVTHWTHQRGSCCFYYALPGVTHACATCPRVDDAERARLLGEARPLDEMGRN